MFCACKSVTDPVRPEGRNKRLMPYNSDMLHHQGVTECMQFQVTPKHFYVTATCLLGILHKLLHYIACGRQADSVAALWTAALACGADGRSAALSAALEVVTAAPTPPLAQPLAGERLGHSVLPGHGLVAVAPRDAHRHGHSFRSAGASQQRNRSTAAFTFCATRATKPLWCVRRQVARCAGGRGRGRCGLGGAAAGSCLVAGRARECRHGRDGWAGGGPGGPGGSGGGSAPQCPRRRDGGQPRPGPCLRRARRRKGRGRGGG